MSEQDTEDVLNGFKSMWSKTDKKDIKIEVGNELSAFIPIEREAKRAPISKIVAGRDVLSSLD